MQVDELPSYTVVVAATNHSELLDRAAWRRFQLRLSLPMPTSANLVRYIESFASRFSEPLGHTPESLAKRLGPISYADVEQFCLDLQRRHILALGEKSIKRVVSEQLDIWHERDKAQRISRRGERRGRAAASAASKA